MTTEQLKEIAPEWVVVEKGEIRPRNPYIHCNGRYYDKDNMPPCCSECECDYWLKIEDRAKQHTYATDLLPGTYSADGLKVVWQFGNEQSNSWATEVNPEDWDGWDDYQVWHKKYGWDTRLFITKA